MMKKFMALLLSGMLTFSLVACGGSEAAADDEVVEETVKETEKEVEETEETVEETVAETEEEVVEETGIANGMWDDVPQVAAPDLSNTTWYFAGGCIDGVEMTQEDMDAALEMYGGLLQFVFDENGGATMVQGNGVLEGTYSYEEQESVSVVFDNNGTDLTYVCLFTEADEILMMAFSDDTGLNCVYFENEANLAREGEGEGVGDGSETVQIEAPDLSNTTWSFAGGILDGDEMTQEDAEAALELYGGTLQFAFDADGGVQMIQGGGTVDGTYSYLDENAVGVVFDYEGTELRYYCVFLESDQVVMTAWSDETLTNAVYMVQ